MQNLNCPICDSSEGKAEYKLPYGSVIKCAVCPLSYTRFNDMEIFYSANMTWNDPEKFKSNIYSHNESKKTANERLKLLKYFISSGKLIEFGPNTGEFLAASHDAGFKATGVDQCSAILNINKRKDIHIINSSVNNLHINERFDVVVAFHLLEHLEKPVDFLKSVKSILNENGYLFLEVPNYNARSRKETGSKWNLFFDYHISHYDLQSLRYLLGKCGYQIVYSRSMQPMTFLDSFYLSMRNFIWSRIKSIIYKKSFIKTKNSTQDMVKRTSENLLMEEKKILNSIKCKLFNLELFLKSILVLPWFPYAKFLSSKEEGDILQVVVIKE